MPTEYPFVQAYLLALHDIILRSGVPAINADLASRLRTSLNLKQVLTITGGPTSGTVDLAWNAQTATIGFNATAGDIQTALRALPNVAGAVDVAGSNPFLITFKGAAAASPVSLIVATPHLGGGVSPSAKVISYRVPQFGDTNVVIGDPIAVSEPVMCICEGGEDVVKDAASPCRYKLSLAADIRVKTPWAADNAPEDFAFLFAIVRDNLRDLLTNASTRTISPKDPNGNALLRDGQTFQNAMYTGARLIAYPVQTPAGRQRCKGITIGHYCDTHYYETRPAPLLAS